MNIIDAIKYVKFKEVKRAMKYHYPDTSKKSMDQYEKIMKEIGEYKLKEDKNWELRIDLVTASKFYVKREKKWYDDIKIGEEYYVTHVKKMLKDKDDYYGCYAIEFTRWEESSKWKISTDVLKKYTLPEIIAHYLWEITYCGFTQKQSQNKLKELHKRIAMIKDNIGSSLPLDKEKLKNFGK
jgi:hypothetical protein